MNEEYLPNGDRLVFYSLSTENTGCLCLFGRLTIPSQEGGFNNTTLFAPLFSDVFFGLLSTVGALSLKRKTGAVLAAGST